MKQEIIKLNKTKFVKEYGRFPDAAIVEALIDRHTLKEEPDYSVSPVQKKYEKCYLGTCDHPMFVHPPMGPIKRQDKAKGEHEHDWLMTENYTRCRVCGTFPNMTKEFLASKPTATLPKPIVVRDGVYGTKAVKKINEIISYLAKDKPKYDF